jgi:hypothetical protein
MDHFLRRVARVRKLAIHDPLLIDSPARSVTMRSRWDSLLLVRCDLLFFLVLLKCRTLHCANGTVVAGEIPLILRMVR